MLLRLVLHSHQKYLILVICAAMMRQENMIMKNRTIFSPRMYYFFVLLMHSSCLRTFSDMEYWIADKTNMCSDFPQMST